MISNEELEMLEQFKASSSKSNNLHSLLVQVSAKELIYGPDTLLQNSTNNNKYLNLMVIQDEEDGAATVYLVPPKVNQNPELTPESEPALEEVPPEVQ